MSVRRKRLSSHLSEVLEDDGGSLSCLLCRCSVDSALGPLYEYVVQSSPTLAHFFCLLFSPGLAQEEDESLGILGFLPENILAEHRRSKRLKCYYCKKSSASMGCSVSSCCKSYHLPCAMKNEGLLIFKDTFDSYCQGHAPKQKIPKRHLKKDSSQMECSICLSELSQLGKCLWSPCCGSWAHKDCLSSYAASSGYFFKCPLCNDAEVFSKEMRSFGIYVPEQDASWERMPNAFEELTERYGRCDRPGACLCPQGRDHDVDYSQWEIILCRFCGSSGIHAECGGLFNSDKETKVPKWTCDLCHNVSKRLPTHHFHPVNKNKKVLVNKRSAGAMLRTMTFKVSGSDESPLLTLVLSGKEILSTVKNKENIPSPVSCVVPPKLTAGPSPSSCQPSTSQDSPPPVIVPILPKANQSVIDFGAPTRPISTFKKLKIRFKRKFHLDDDDDVPATKSASPSTSPSNASPLQPTRRKFSLEQPPAKKQKISSSPKSHKVKNISIIDPKQKFINNFFFKLS